MRLYKKKGLDMRETPIEKEVYEHFKGHRYQILAIAKDANTMEELVVYQGTYEPYQVFVRGVEEFLSPVDRDKYPEANQENRFEKCDLSEEQEMHPKLAKFLDADSYEEKLGILISMEHVITNSMINTMSIVLEVEVPEGEKEVRYESLKNALRTLEKFECNRFR